MFRRKLTRWALVVLAGASALAIAPAPSSRAAIHAGGCRPTVLIGSTDLDPVGEDPCPGIRPGAWVEGSVGRCTVNFIFSDGKRLMAGTAGHCVKKVGEVVSSVSLHRDIGRVVYRIRKSFFKDFALIGVYPELWSDVDPEACVWGGPTGIASGPQSEYSEIRHMGYGYALGYVPMSENAQPLTYARRGIAPHLDDPEQMHFLGTVAGGDSGSGAYLADGSALGVITVIEASVSTSDGVRGLVGGGRLDFLMGMASRALRRPLYLVTANGGLAGPVMSVPAPADERGQP